MKPYLTQNRVPLSGMVLLVIGSIVLGIATGVLAYFVSTIFYLLFVFSLLVGAVTMLVYYRLLQFCKVCHSTITTVLGVVAGILVALAYYGTAYVLIRHEFINKTLDTYHISKAQAAAYFQQILIEETGSSGLPGYMKYRAMAGDQYTNVVFVNTIAVHAFDFTLKSTWAWLYWLLEVVLFSVPAAWIGYDTGKRPFSQSANDWYSTIPKQCCAIPLEHKDELLMRLKASRLIEISELAVAEEEISHPMIELDAQWSSHKKGDVLLTAQQTYRDQKGKIKRNMLGRWEAGGSEYGAFVEAVKHRLLSHSGSEALSQDSR